MPGPDFRFSSRWHIPGEPAEVFGLLADAATWAAWWGPVHAAAHVLEAGRPDGLGRTVELASGARLARERRLRVTVASVNRPHAAGLELRGDAEGEASWHLRREGPYVVADLACLLRPRGAVGRLWLGPLAPLARAGFGRAMRQGLLGLRLELRRRHAVTAHERAMIPRLGRTGRGATRAGAGAGLLLPELTDEPREPAG